jgi:hypothetical protein
MDKIREWTEIGKMMEALKKNAPKKSFLMDEVDMTIYEEVKDLYFRNILNINDYVKVDLSLKEDVYVNLMSQADEREIPFDEIINKALDQVIEKASGHAGYPQYEYRYLKLGDYMEEGDEYCEHGKEEEGYLPVHIHHLKQRNIFTNSSCAVRRKIKKEELQYRLLNYCEKVEEGDEWLSIPDNTWYKTVWPFPPVYQIDRTAIYRRLMK